MFRASNDISGIDKKTLPSELIPLNAIQLSRGLLNYTVIQSRLNWVYPFWAEEQYNPNKKSFIPRSHSGLSMNVTNRNWTAVGNPDCNIEPIVDPRGMITPFINGWSVDIWLRAGDKIFFPSTEQSVKQSLIDDLPIVKTEYFFDKLKAEAVAYVQGNTLKIKIVAEEEINNSSLVVAIRPFNPEGVSLLNSIEFKDNHFIIDKKKLEFDKTPGFVFCSDFEDGDSSKILNNIEEHLQKFSTYCETGLANAIAVFNIKDKFNLTMSCNLEDDKNIDHPDPVDYWNDLLRKGTEIKTPDENLNSLLKASLTSAILLCDEDKITPGPFTYHQLWFRDAAFMIYALDRFGFHKLSRQIVNTFVKHQDKHGYFRSQKGEWDSNGQALWTIFQHSILSDDISFLEKNFDSLKNGIKWIDKARLKSDEFKKKNFYGLLPKGLSAEHVGLADYYFWDNFWSLAGIKSFIQISEMLEKKDDKKYAQSLLIEYQGDVEQSIRNMQQKYKTRSITSSATRGIDGGIIGSICALYPLQLSDPEDEKIITALKILNEEYFYEGMFFQHFIHSGMNPYLTLQIAHSYLFAGDREKFLEIFNEVASNASQTKNFPEAIHPFTKGGCMGDGHHGWAASEILLSAADSFAYEYGKEIYLLAGIPKEWFLDSKSFYVKKLKLKSGIISISCSSVSDEVKIEIEFEESEIYKMESFVIKLPSEFEMKGNDNFDITYKNGETHLKSKCFSAGIILLRKDKELKNSLQQQS